jgi:hypothetical protein
MLKVPQWIRMRQQEQQPTPAEEARGLPVAPTQELQQMQQPTPIPQVDPLQAGVEPLPEDMQQMLYEDPGYGEIPPGDDIDSFNAPTTMTTGQAAIDPMGGQMVDPTFDPSILPPPRFA